MSFPGNPPIGPKDSATPPQSSTPATGTPRRSPRQLPPVPLFSAPVPPPSWQRLVASLQPTAAPQASSTPSTSASSSQLPQLLPLPPQASSASAASTSQARQPIDLQRPIRNAIYEALKNPNFDLFEVVGKLRAYPPLPTRSEEQARLESLIFGHYFNRDRATLMEAYRAHAAVFLLDPFSELESYEKTYTLDRMQYMSQEYAKKPNNIDLDDAREFLLELSKMGQDSFLSFSHILSGYLARQDADLSKALQFAKDFYRNVIPSAMQQQILEAYLNNPNFSPQQTLLFIQQMDKDLQQQGLESLFEVLSKQDEPDLKSLYEIRNLARPELSQKVTAFIDTKRRSSKRLRNLNPASAASSDSPQDPPANPLESSSASPPEFFPFLLRPYTQTRIAEIRQETRSLVHVPNFDLKQVVVETSEKLGQFVTGLRKESHQISMSPSIQEAWAECMKMIFSHYFSRETASLREAQEAFVSVTRPLVTPITIGLMNHILQEYTKKRSIHLTEVAAFLNQMRTWGVPEELLEPHYYSILLSYLKQPHFGPLTALNFAAQIYRYNRLLKRTLQAMRQRIFDAYLKKPNFNPEVALMIAQRMPDEAQRTQGVLAILDALLQQPRVIDEDPLRRIAAQFLNHQEVRGKVAALFQKQSLKKRKQPSDA